MIQNDDYKSIKWWRKGLYENRGVQIFTDGHIGGAVPTKRPFELQKNDSHNSKGWSMSYLSHIHMQTSDKLFPQLQRSVHVIFIFELQKNRKVCSILHSSSG